ncbi:TPA: hypothetical protein ACX6NV_000596 [Photobacterium damselae]
MPYREWPSDLVPSKNSIKLVQPTFTYESNFTGAIQTSYHPGAKWVLSMTFENLPDHKRRVLSAFLNGMQGKLEAVKVVEHTRRGYPVPGMPVVSGDNNTGRNLLTMGWLPSVRVARIGDVFTVNNEYKQIDRDIWSDINGTATLFFNPPLRKIPPNSAPLEFENPYILANLDSDGINESTVPGRFTSFEEITFTEAIYK